MPAPKSGPLVITEIHAEASRTVFSNNTRTSSWKLKRDLGAPLV